MHVFGEKLEVHKLMTGGSGAENSLNCFMSTMLHLFGKFLEMSDLVGVGAGSHQMGNSLGISDLVSPPFQIQPLLIDT